MNNTGKKNGWRALLATCFLLIATNSALAEVIASVDRDRVVMGDTLRLALTATDGEDVSNIDLRPLLADFQVLQRSTSSNTSIVNGVRSHTRQLLMDIAPKREGTLQIPPLKVGNDSSNMLLISVGPAPKAGGAGQTVIFEAELDRDSVYVQGQVILTLRLQQAINLDNRSISELSLENAFVKPLEQRSFQRNVDGRPWLVNELRYAIFPEQSGTLEIPAQSFTARESQPRRSLFDRGDSGRLLRRQTEALSIEVLPRPDSFPGDTWLPARSLNVEESWSTPPEQLKAGESATRTIRIRGEGLQGAQLPPVLFPATEGLKYYPDQPEITDTEVSSGLLGTRQDSAALVPTRAGSLQIPEIRIPWWDTETGELRYAVVPGREIAVRAAAPAVPASATVDTATGAETTPAAVVVASGDTLIWKIVSAVTGIGWLLTLLWISWTRFRSPQINAAAATENHSEARAFKHLQSALSSGSPSRARQAVVDWARALLPDNPPVSLEQVASRFADAELAAGLAKLDAALYGSSGSDWNGSALLERLTDLRQQHRRNLKDRREPLSLYPQPA